MNEKATILAMLDNGKISAEEAARLIEALNDGETVTSNNNNNANRPAGRPVNPALKGKKLRVKVEGSMDEMQNVHVNVALPLSLARIADGIISNVIPKEVNKELEDQGISLKSLNLGEIVDALTDADEDIVNVNVEMDGKPVMVRVYVE